MGKKVFANGMEIAHKAGAGKVIAAFPDVCLSPPPPPAGPVPIPYPNTSSATDLRDGSSTVQIGGQPLAIKGQSFYQSSPLGNEAATRNFGAAVLTHTISGKTYFQASSMDVLVEGKPVCRHLDITTCNHASYPGSTPPMPNAEGMVVLALARIQDKRCPCCGDKACAAAFKEGEEPLSFHEYYRIDAQEKGKLTRQGQERGERIRKIIKIKKKRCCCTRGNRVFPQAPCDVFRAPNTDRKLKIASMWESSRDKYKAWWKSQNGRALRSDVDVMNELRAAAGGTFTAEQAKAARSYALKQTRINHLVPQQAGGCPNNPGNLQPQDELCAYCQSIDDEFTKCWQQ